MTANRVSRALFLLLFAAGVWWGTAVFLSPSSFMQNMSVFWLPVLPLYGGSVGIAAAALGALLLAMVTGRAFCGWICPLGTMQDVAWRVRTMFLRARPVPPAGALAAYRHALAVALMVMLVGGIPLLWLFSPLPAFARIQVMLLQIVDTVGVRLPGHPHLVRRFALFVPLVAAAGAFLLAAAARRRWWCRYVCPLGTALGTVAAHARIKRNVDEDVCTHCGACMRACPMGAIPSPEKTLYHVCITCTRCAAVCPVNCISFGRGGVETGGVKATGLTRRQVLAGATGGAAALLLARGRSTAVIRPPGAVEEERFLALCVRCGRCIGVCVTNGLQPAASEAGIAGILTPVMKNRQGGERGGCDNGCNACGTVCPTEAIRPLSLLEKSFAKMGTARVDRTRCLAWHDRIACLACEEICPYAAIDVDTKDGIGRPVVQPDACMGCGLCERVCPVEGRAAIEVSPDGADRRSTGTYATPAKRRLRTRRIEAKRHQAKDAW